MKHLIQNATANSFAKCLRVNLTGLDPRDFMHYELCKVAERSRSHPGLALDVAEADCEIDFGCSMFGVPLVAFEHSGSCHVWKADFELYQLLQGDEEEHAVWQKITTCSVHDCEPVGEGEKCANW